MVDIGPVIVYPDLFSPGVNTIYVPTLVSILFKNPCIR